MKITKIEKSKHKQERVLVFLEGGDLLRITGHELLQFGLYPGMDLSDELVVQLAESAGHSEVRARAAQMASSRMLSKKELTERLLKKGVAQDEASDTADWLEELGAVDDAAYAGVVVRHYAGMGYGAGRVRQELFRRGISRELWEDAMEQLPPPEEAIEQFLRSKLKGKSLDRQTGKKLSDALLRRGFGWSDIRPVLNRMGEEIDE
ncbi:MAG: regulatory protein RecX [Clostridiales bacterium]|nr:regulatory protein RecX [Candidatus Cacconaster stercorequi]